MRVLVLNLGSSSIKFQLFNMDKHMVLAKGLVEQIGEPEGKISISTSTKASQSETLKITDHAHGLLKMQEKLQVMGVLKSLEHIDGVGHRVVQGGIYSSSPL
ncbi:hypothetical protein NHP21005_01750 [Helicobacter sp. NHP21005]|nr:hypothetical protein NHP21005_01750 [Helicobacter sp. NHP21005]